MSILILFQFFKVTDEIFDNKKDQEKGYIILEKDDGDELEIAEDKSNVKNEKIDYESLFSQANLEGGEKIAKQCVACHSFDDSLKVKVGPPLWGVVNRNAASIADFKYSDALINFKKAWSRKELFYFLEKPKDYIKGTKMIYKGLKKPSDRVNLISYLESLK